MTMEKELLGSFLLANDFVIQGNKKLVICDCWLKLISEEAHEEQYKM